MDFREGQTATHKDGRKIVYHQGAWHLAPQQAPGSGPSGQPLQGGVNTEWLSRRQRGEPVLHPNDDPFRSLRDPGTREKAVARSLGQGSDYLSKQRDAVSAAHDSLQNLDEFDRLNDSIKPTGGIVNRLGNATREFLGNHDLTRMDEIAQNMARHQRQPGEGAVSDFEGKIFQRMVGGSDKPYQANREFSQATRAITQKRIQFHQFQEAYLRSNGTLVGAESMWSAYRDHNPVFDGKGHVRQVPSWQQFFRDEAEGLAGVKRNLPKPPPSAANNGWSVQRVK